MNRTLQNCHDWLISRETQRDGLLAESAKIERTLKEREVDAAGLDRARTIVNEVLCLTYDALRTYVEEVVGLALSTVYGERYGFELALEVKRGQSEAAPWITKGADRFSPRNECGGGVLDVASLAFRLALWSVKEPRSAPVFILDEPARFLSRDLQGKFGEVLKKLSKMLGLQILMVSHSDGTIENADRAWTVTQTKGISEVKPIV